MLTKSYQDNSQLIKKKNYNKKVTDTKSKIPGDNGLVTTESVSSKVTRIEKKIPNNILNPEYKGNRIPSNFNLVIKAALNTTSTETKKKIPDVVLLLLLNLIN